MSEKVVIKPRKGLKVPNPQRNWRLLAEDGELVVLDSYWRRRLKDKEVFYVQQPAEGNAGQGSEGEEE